MTLLSRAVTTGKRLTVSAIKTNSDIKTADGYTVQNQKGSTGSTKNSGWWDTTKAVGYLAFQVIKANAISSLKALGTLYLEDLTRQFTTSSMYERLNQVEWSDTRLWEIRLEGLPKPFQAFTPVSNASVQAIDISLGTFTVGNTSWQYIEGQGTRTITLSIQDDVTGTMEEFLYQWMDTVTGYKVTGNTPIEKAGKIMKFRKLSRSKYMTTESVMYVVPQGRLNIDNNQNSNTVRTIDITFAILGIERYRTSQLFPYSDIAKLAAKVTSNLIRRNKYAYQFKRSTVGKILAM